MNKIQELEAALTELETDLVLCRQIITNQKQIIDNDYAQQIYLMHKQHTITTGHNLDEARVRTDIKNFNKYFNK